MVKASAEERAAAAAEIEAEDVRKLAELGYKQVRAAARFATACSAKMFCERVRLAAWLFAQAPKNRGRRSPVAQELSRGLSSAWAGRGLSDTPPV